MARRHRMEEDIYMSRIYNISYKSIGKDSPIEKWSKDTKKHFKKLQMTNKGKDA